MRIRDFWSHARIIFNFFLWPRSRKRANEHTKKQLDFWKVLVYGGEMQKKGKITRRGRPTNYAFANNRHQRKAGTLLLQESNLDGASSAISAEATARSDTATLPRASVSGVSAVRRSCKPPTSESDPERGATFSTEAGGSNPQRPSKPDNVKVNEEPSLSENLPAPALAEPKPRPQAEKVGGEARESDRTISLAAEGRKETVGSRGGQILSILLALFLAACSTTETSSSESTDWTCQYCKNVTLNQTGSTFWFTFPPKDGVHYVTKNVSASSATISATFKIEGAGKFTAAGGGTPQVRLYFQRKGDNMSAQGDYQYYRWWSAQTAVLKNGTFTLSVPLIPKNWSSVYGVTGDKAVKQFNAATGDALLAGLTFGDQYGAGHGVWGSGKFTLISYTIK